MNIPAGEFKARCLQLMDNVNLSHEEIIITKFGKPVAKLVPVEEEPKKLLFGFLKGTVVIKGDIVASTGEQWDANR
jgi:prevent-host-death family protein